MNLVESGVSAQLQKKPMSRIALSSSVTSAYLRTGLPTAAGLPFIESSEEFIRLNLGDECHPQACYTIYRFWSVTSNSDSEGGMWGIRTITTFSYAFTGKHGSRRFRH